MALQKNRFILSLLLVISILSAISQNRSYRFDRLGSNEGISYSQVNCVFQDQKGFMWFGTSLGLNRYDGYNITKYFHSTKDSTTLSSNSIGFICDDEDDNLLVASSQGLDILNIGTNKFTRAKLIREKNVKGRVQLSNYYINQQGIRFFGTNKGLYYFNHSKKQVEPYLINGKTICDSTFSINGVVCDKFGYIWISYRVIDGNHSPYLRKVDPKDGSAKTYALDEKQLKGIYYDYLGNIWMPADKGLIEFNPITEKSKYYAVPDDKFYSNNSFFGTRSGEIWQGFWSFGATKFDVVNKKFEIHVNDPLNPESISDNVINEIYEDYNGVLWFATNEGVSKLSFDKQHFAIIPFSKTIQHITTQKVLFSTKSKYYPNRYYIGTNGEGLILFDEKEKRSESFSPTGKIKTLERFINNVYEQNEKVLWVAGNFNFYKIEVNEKGFVKSKSFFEDYKLYFTFIYPDANDPTILWLGTLNSLIEFNTKTETYLAHHLPKDDFYIYQITEISKSKILLLHGKSIIVFDKLTKKIEKYTYPDDSYLLSLMKDKNGERVYIGSHSNGLLSFNLLTRKLTKLPKAFESEIPDISNIVEHDEYIWFATNKGLVRFSPKDNLVLLYSTSDGLPNNIVNSLSVTPDNKLLLSTNSGVCLLDPINTKKNMDPPKLTFTTLRITNKHDSLINIINEASRNLTLEHNENFLNIKFAALDFHNSTKNVYKFRMNGIDTIWKTISNRNVLYFDDLKPGKYSLEIYGSNSGDIWTENPITLNITILPPFYKTAWFFITALGVLVIMSFFIMYFIRRSRLESYKQNNDLKYEINSLRSIWIFGGVSYPFVGFLFQWLYENVNFQPYFLAAYFFIVMTIWAASFKISFIQDKAKFITKLFFYVLIGHILYVTHLHNLNFINVASLFMALTATTLVFNNYKDLFWFVLFITSAACYTAYSLETPQTDSSLYIIGVITISFVSFMTINITANLKNRMDFSDRILNKTDSIVIAADRKGNIVYTNDGATRALGYSMAEILGDGWWKIRGESKESNEEVKQRVMEDKIVQDNYTSLIKSKDGENKWIQWVDTKIDEEIVVGIGQDVTEQVEIRAQYQLLVENANDIIYKADNTGHIVYVNEVTEKVLGYTKDEIIGKHYSSFIEKSQRVQAMRFYIDMYQNKTKDSYYVFPAIGKNNKPKWLGQSVKLLFDEEENIIGFQSIARDITEQIEAEKKIKAYSSRLETINLINESFINSVSVEQLYINVLAALKRTFKDCQQISITNYIDDTAEFNYLRNGKLDKINYSFKTLRNYHPFQSLRPVIVQDLEKDIFDPIEERLSHDGIRSYISYPIFFEKKLYASLNADFGYANAISVDVFDLIEQICESLALVLNQLKLQSELAEKNKDITDSINYANRIQKALYPDSEYLKQLVKANSIIFKPRDIVSGDFYWMEKSGDNLLFAVGDCTGHGVPGAMLSMLAQSLLNQAVNEKRILEPSLILKYLCVSFTHALKRANVNLKDGFDISIVNINLATRNLSFSGAMQSIFILQNDEIIRIKGNKTTIDIKDDLNVRFDEYDFTLEEGDIVCLYSDGMIDQFGGERNKKLNTKGLQQWALESVAHPNKQAFFDKKLNDWMKNSEQIDDITLITLMPF